VAWPHTNDAVQQLSENVILYDLAQMRGKNALLSRIPEHISGVYAWYRRFELDPNAKNDPDIFVNSILDELCKDHSAPRETGLPPMYRIILKPETSFSKELVLKELSVDSAFRELLFMLLNNSLIFQQPLYIGRATNLYCRIRNHLREGSILRERLGAAGHNISRCRLLLIYTSPNTSSLDMDLDNLVDDNEFDHQAVQDCEFSEFGSEILIEDILSRLFLPSFTLRYG